MNIEKGMYVRTEYGKIGTIISFYCRNEMADIWRITVEFQDGEKEEICSHLNKHEPTFNLIDLIEVGDMVNNRFVKKIIDVNEYNYEIYLDCEDGGNNECSCFQNKDIKTILTHEQIEQHSYKVGE